MLLEFTDRGIYCPKADVYIDPWRPVNRALITHGHSDHCSRGHKYYLCTRSAIPVVKYRMGGDINIEGVDFGQTVRINGVDFSFHPAGHILGSAQIKVTCKGEVWVISGDYKVENDGLSEPFEPLRCHYFISECTFGLPLYSWSPQEALFEEINQWWRQNKALGIVTVLSGYSLGKAQRIIQHLDPSIGRIYTHGAVENINEIVRSQGINLQLTHRVVTDQKKDDYAGSIIIAPPSAIGSPWMKRFLPYSVGIASGWMQLRGARRRRSVDRGFALSDHADWYGLNQAIEETGAEKVYLTHGYTSACSRWLNEKGIEAEELKTHFEGELEEIGEGIEDGQSGMSRKSEETG